MVAQVPNGRPTCILFISAAFSSILHSSCECASPAEMSSSRSVPYKRPSKGTSNGKGSKRASAEHIDTDSNTIKGTSKGKGSKSSSSSSMGGKGPSERQVPPDFSRLGGKGELLQRLWFLAELEDEEGENKLARIRFIMEKRRRRMAQAIELLDQVREMEAEYVRKWRIMNNTSEYPPVLSLDEFIPSEFVGLL